MLPFVCRDQGDSNDRRNHSHHAHKVPPVKPAAAIPAATAAKAHAAAAGRIHKLSTVGIVTLSAPSAVAYLPRKRRIQNRRIRILANLLYCAYRRPNIMASNHKEIGICTLEAAVATTGFSRNTARPATAEHPTQSLWIYLFNFTQGEKRACKQISKCEFRHGDRKRCMQQPERHNDLKLMKHAADQEV